MSRIELDIVASGNFRQVETAISRLRAQVAGLNSAMMGTTAFDDRIPSIQRYVKEFENAIDASGQFERHLVNVTSETQKFGRQLETGSTRLNQLFRAASEYRRGEIGQIRQLAREQVRLQNAVTMTMPDGRAQVIVPKGLDEAVDRQRILNQEYRIFRQVVQNGSTEIINWGKNTQWAGRQLTVGLTVPLTIFGAAASKVFMDADRQLTRMAKVYGDASKGMVNERELESIRNKTLSLAQDIASSMGVAVEETLGIAADIAATGKEGNDLLEATREAMRLSVLGEVDRQEAMKATLAIQSVFKQDSIELANSINLLNAVENQTSTTLNDLVTGIIKAGPVVQGLGGDIADLASMMVAMREGGIPASEAANAIKSSLGGLINPTKQTTEVLRGFGVNLTDIVDKNAGDVIGTLVALQTELDNLDELSRQRAIEQMFGKFQFSRINALLNNLNKAGSQTQQVLKIAGMSTAQLAETAERELTTLTESASMKFQRAVESLKANLIPIGEVFTNVATMLLEVGNKIINVFNSLPDPIKRVVQGIGGLVAIAGPIIMITGVLGNFFGYIVKGISSFLALKKAGRGVFEVFTPESVATNKAVETLTSSLFDQESAMSTLGSSVDILVRKLETLAQSMSNVNTSGSNTASTLANIEAGMLSGPAQVQYTTPTTGFRRGYRPADMPRTNADIQYSHLYPDTALRSALTSRGYSETEISRTSVTGTFVGGLAKDIQQAFQDSFVPTMFELDENDPNIANIRRQMFEQMLSSAPVGVQEQVRSRITAAGGQVSDVELAQLMPSMQKFKASNLKYLALMEAAGDLSATHTTEIQAAFDRYKAQVLEGVDAETAFNELVASVNAFDGAVDTKMAQIGQGFDEVLAEISQIQDPTQRRQRFNQYLVDITEKEILASKGIAAGGVSGVATGKSDSPQRAIAYGAQMMGDTAINMAGVSEELTAAYRNNRDSQNKLADSTEDVLRSSERLQSAEDARTNATNELNKTLKRKKTQEEDYIRIVDDYGNVMWRNSKTNTETTKLESERLERLHQSRLDEQSAREELTAAVQRSEQAELDAADAATRLAEQRQRHIEAEKKNSDATDKNTNATRQDTQATLDSANSERTDATASKNLADAENQDAINTRQSAMAEGQDARGGRGRLATAGSVGIGVLGAASMFIPQTGNETVNGLIDVLGMAGMGASIGSMAGPPGMIAGAAIGAAIPLVNKFNEEQQKVNDSLLSYGMALSGAAGVLSGFAEQTGRRTPTQVLAESLSGLTLPEEDLQEAASILESEIGQGMISAARNLTGPERFESLNRQLQQLTLTGIFTPDEAKAVAQQLGVELGDPALGESLVNGIISILDRDGQLIKDAVSRQLVDTVPDLDIMVPEFDLSKTDYFKTGQISMSEEIAAGFESLAEAPISTMLSGLTGGAIGGDVYASNIEQRVAQRFAQANMGLIVGSIESLRQAQAQANIEFSQGLITYDEYLKRLADIDEKATSGKETIDKLRQAADGQVDVSSLIKDIANTEGNLEQFELVQSAAESLFDTLGVGAKFLTDLQIGAAFGQIDSGQIAEFANMFNTGNILQDAVVQAKVRFIFDQEGSDNNAMRIIQLMNQGVSADLILNFIEQGKSIDEALSEIEGMNTALATLPSELSTRIFLEVGDSPEKIAQFNRDYQSVMELPDSRKELETVLLSDPEFANVKPYLEQIMALPDDIRKSVILEVKQFGTADFSIPSIFAAAGTASMEGAKEDTSAVSAAISEAFASSGGGGGSSDTSAIEEAYDKKIKQQDRIIKQIQKEREERQKLLDLEKQALDFAMRQQDLENQIARAKAEGRLADAALLQSQLDAEIGSQESQERERLRQEEEDRRIARAEREKKRLEREKQKATEAASGGGGGGGQVDTAAIEQRVNLLRNELIQFITDNVDLARIADAEGPLDAFFNSKKVKEFNDELAKMGIPKEFRDMILNDIFGDWVSQSYEGAPLFTSTQDGLTKIGLSMQDIEKTAPIAFAALQDPNLTSTEKIDLITQALQDLGYSAPEAQRRAEELLKFIQTKPDQESTMMKLMEDQMKMFGLSSGDAKVAAEKVWQVITDPSITREEKISEINKLLQDNKVDSDKAKEASKNWVDSLGIPQSALESYYNLGGAYDEYIGSARQAYIAQRIAAYSIANPEATQIDVQSVAENAARAWDSGIDAYMAMGGKVRGPGGPTDDKILAALSNGEYVIRASSVNKYGVPFLDMINQGMLPALAAGGYSRYPGAVNRMAGGGMVSYYNKGGLVSENGNNVEYNINVNVAGTNASADEIARKVMQKIERSEKMRGAKVRI